MKLLVVVGSLLAADFGAIAALAPYLFVADPEKVLRAGPAFLFVGAMLVAGGLWWIAWIRIRELALGRRGLWIIFAFAILFRGILIATPPILELDLYRYLWDGFVAGKGVSSFRYSPAEVAEAIRMGDLEKDPTLRRLASVVESDRAAGDLLRLVHYPELTTAYPIASQAVFFAANQISVDKSIDTRLLVLKLTLLTFEIATWPLVVFLLRRCHRPVEWLILPAWCPLAVLSVANQGHLDVVPAFFVVAALAALIWRQSLFCSSAAGVLLAVACSAKVYPVVLMPLVVAYIVASNGFIPRLIGFVLAFAVASALLWSPFFGGERLGGLSTFARSWEMNDALFALVEGNLKSSKDVADPWYVVVPAAWRQSIAHPGMTARAVWLVFTAALVTSIAVGLFRRPSTERLLQSAFILLVWFWAAGPVCNPWYLLWMLPLLPFVGNPGWMLLFVVAPAMFLRFGLAAQFGERGEYWYDHGVVFAITFSWMALLVVGHRMPFSFRKKTTSPLAGEVAAERRVGG